MEFLTKLEELVLIAVLKLKGEAYSVSIYNFVVNITGKDVSVSSVYFPLERLVRKGYLQCFQSDPTPKRGGMSKRHYRLTRSGYKALEENRSLSQTVWKGVGPLLKNTPES
ncbi:helix-turn-helix transcriptional regulator [Acidobacteriota bacterium]